jgi:hypothetical protein
MTEPTTPMLRIVRGTPTAEEVAALVAVLAAASSTPTAPRRAPRSAWAAPDRVVRQPLTQGGWSRSLAPR